MSDGPKKRSLGWIGCWALVTLLVLYPLSIGPAVWISFALGQPADWTNRPYRPVLWLAFQSDVSNKILYEYMNFYSTLRWGREPSPL
jgi:hypothetical protein